MEVRPPWRRSIISGAASGWARLREYVPVMTRCPISRSVGRSYEPRSSVEARRAGLTMSTHPTHPTRSMPYVDLVRQLDAVRVVLDRAVSMPETDPVYR